MLCRTGHHSLRALTSQRKQFFSKGRCPDIDRLLPPSSLDVTPVPSHFAFPTNGGTNHIRFDDNSRFLNPRAAPQMNGSQQHPPPIPQPSGVGFFTPMSNGSQNPAQPHSHYQKGSNGPIPPFRLGQPSNQNGRDVMSGCVAQAKHRNSPSY